MPPVRRRLIGLGLAISATVAAAADCHSHPRAAQVTALPYRLKQRPQASHRVHAALLRNGMSDDRAVPMRG